MGFVADELGLPLHGHDHTPAATAITGALRGSAEARGLRDAALESAVAEVAATPIVFAAPFLDARFLWADAFRFRACRVAIAFAEDDHIDADTPAAAAAIVERLVRWRELFVAEGASKRAVNAVLADVGERLPTGALWGLRHVPLTRARTSPRHLEVLGWLGALPNAAGLAELIALVARASDDELDVVCAHDGPLRPVHTVPQRIAQVLAEGDAANSASLLQLARSGWERVTAARSGAGNFPRPPIPLPDVEGIRWLSSHEELLREGEAMHHCVARRTATCMQGAAYIFHVQRGQSHATIQMSAIGTVDEAQGPFNRPSAAIAWGSDVLRRWGARLWAAGLPPDSLAWPHALDVPAGARPLRSVRAIREAFDAIAPTHADLLRLRNWIYDVTIEAGRGEVGLVVDRDDPTLLVAYDALGRRMGDSRDLALRSVAPPRSARAQSAEALLVRGALRAGLERPPADAWRAPPPPFPYPALQGVCALDDHASWQRAGARFGRFLAPVLPRVLAGEVVLFEVTLAASSAILEVSLRPRTVVAHHHGGAEPAELARVAERVRGWARGMWAVHIGMQRCTWLSDLRVPPGAEALRTVEECALLYQRLVELFGDRDGALAAFFERWVGAAVRGDAWLVVRDRAAGRVSALDRKRNVVVRTDELAMLGAPVAARGTVR